MIPWRDFDVPEPYLAPSCALVRRSSVSEANADHSSTTGSGRPVPVHLWIVGVLALLWNAFGAYDYLMVQTANEAYMAEFTAEQLAYYEGFSLWATSVWAIAIWGSVLGSILLLLRKKLAEPVFLVALVALLINTVRTSLTGGWELMGGTQVIAFSALIIVVAVFLWLYARAMRIRGLLI
jgi:hypothetical protein